MRRLLALAAAVAVVAVATPGCFGHECEGGNIHRWGSGPGEGALVDADTWESTEVGGTWLEFPPKDKWVFFVPAWEAQGRTPTEMYAWISGDPQPNVQDGPVPPNWTLASGNLAEFSLADRGTIQVANDTCAKFFLRVVLRAAPLPNDAGALPTSDASTPR